MCLKKSQKIYILGLAWNPNRSVVQTRSLVRVKALCRDLTGMHWDPAFVNQNPLLQVNIGLVSGQKCQRDKKNMGRGIISRTGPQFPAFEENIHTLQNILLCRAQRKARSSGKNK